MSMRCFVRCIAAIGVMLAALAGCDAGHEDLYATVVRVKDGDTFVARVGAQVETIRLIGIDAPESYHNGKVRYDAKESGMPEQELVAKGRAASAFLKRLLPKGASVRLEFDKQRRDRYRRLLCYVYLGDGTMVNELLVKEGHAIAKRYPPNVRYQERLVKADQDYKSQVPNSKFQGRE